jgi:hypothetical protein
MSSPSEKVRSVARDSAGTIPWNGDAATLERLAIEPEFGLVESRDSQQ